jgi:hypothetical protein
MTTDEMPSSLTAGTTLLNLVKVDHLKPPRIFLYGPEGVGKTTQVCKANKPIVIQTEDGLGHLKVNALPLVQDYTTLLDYLDALITEDHNYKSIILDSVDWADLLICKEVAAQHKVSEVSEIGYGKGFKATAKLWKDVLERFDILRDRGCTPIFTGHSAIVKIEDPIHGDYDKYTIKLHKDSAALLQEWCDIILFAQYDLILKKEDKGFGNKKNRAIADGTRIMHTVGSPTYTAKNRYSLPAQLPLDWVAFQDAFRKSIKGE